MSSPIGGSDPAGSRAVATVREIATPVGPARVTVHRPLVESARGTLVLGHGAGGSGPSADLVALTGLVGSGWNVVLVDQPWRVAGRKLAGPPRQLDAAWGAVWRDLVGHPSASERPRLAPPFVAGGRSAGARVVARTTELLRPDALLLLSFPLVPVRTGAVPGSSRAPELAAAVAAIADSDAPGRPILVVQGHRDPFGTPAQIVAALAPAKGVAIVSVPGAHSLTRGAEEVAQQVSQWLLGLPLRE